MDAFKSLWNESSQKTFDQGHQIREIQSMKMLPYCLSQLEIIKELRRGDREKSVEFKECQNKGNNQWNDYQLRVEWEVRNLEKCLHHVMKSGVNSQREIKMMCFANTEKNLIGHLDNFKKVSKQVVDFDD